MTTNTEAPAELADAEAAYEIERLRDAMIGLINECNKANKAAIQMFAGVVIDHGPLAHASRVLNGEVSFCGGWPNVFGAVAPPAPKLDFEAQRRVNRRLHGRSDTSGCSLGVRLNELLGLRAEARWTMRNSLLDELIGAWEVKAEMEPDAKPGRRETLRECADTLRALMESVAPDQPTEREEQMVELLRSACAIADRQGHGTHWQRFGDSIRKLGLNGITARTYRVLPSDLEA